MRVVENQNEIQTNMDILDYYLNRKTEPTYSYALNLVKRGTCFVAKLTDEGYRFYPSRFIGYANNSMLSHENNPYKSGIETNPAISQIIGTQPRPNPILDKEYRIYCEELGFIANEKGTCGAERKFWEL